MIVLDLFVCRSAAPAGRCRPTAQDPDTAQLMGIDTNRIIVIAFVLGATLAAVAGVCQGMQVGNISYDMGFTAGLKAFTAAVLGGIGNIHGAVLGGLVLGVDRSRCLTPTSPAFRAGRPGGRLAPSSC